MVVSYGFGMELDHLHQYKSICQNPTTDPFW